MANFRLKWHLTRSNRRITAQPRSHWYIGTMSWHSYRWIHLRRPCWCHRRGSNRSISVRSEVGQNRWLQNGAPVLRPPSHTSRILSIKTTNLRQCSRQCSVHAYASNDGLMGSLWPIYTTVINVYVISLHRIHGKLTLLCIFTITIDIVIIWTFQCVNIKL